MFLRTTVFDYDKGIPSWILKKFFRVGPEATSNIGKFKLRKKLYLNMFIAI